jgi:CRISPR-associated endonuclease Cas3-HD
MTTILSYAKGNVREELKVHTREMLRTLNSSANSRAFRFVSNLGTDLHCFSDAVRLAVIFHDFGKIFYQDSWSRDGYLYFTGHEQISATFLKEFLRILRDSDGTALLIKLKYPMLFAVLYHHHAMGSRTIQIDIYPSRLTPLLKEFEVDALCIMKEHELEDYRSALRGTVLRFEELLKTNHQHLLMCAKDTGLSADIWRAYTSDENERSQMLLLLSILVSSDYEASQRIRGGHQSTFYRATKEFADNYL